MKREIYDEVGIVSTLLNQKLDELKACNKEKDELLAWIDELIKAGTLEQNSKVVRERLGKSSERFKKVVSEIDRLNGSLN